MKRILFSFFSISLFLTATCQEKLDKTEVESLEYQEGIQTYQVIYLSGPDTVSSYLAEPAGEGLFPALIVIHEWWGLNESTRNDAKELAKSGYAALAVDLYRGKSTSDSEVAHELMRGLPEDRAIRDLKAAFSFLQEKDNVDKDNIGSIGWCMGGGYSLQAALNIPKLDAAVICYGRLFTDQEMINRIDSPILGIFGANDRGISTDDVKKFESALNEAGIENTIIIYPDVGHAFMNPDNKSGYNKEAADKAWSEIFYFLNAQLK
jgi:carboxymethylenebutenolidase